MVEEHKGTFTKAWINSALMSHKHPDVLCLAWLGMTAVLSPSDEQLANAPFTY